MFHHSISLGFATLYPFDIVYLVIALIVVISTSLEGFSRAVSKHAGIVIGIALGFIFAGSLTNILRDNIDIPILWLTYISYMGIIIIAFIFIKLLGNKLSNIFEASGLRAVDTILGLFYGLFEALVICLLIHVIVVNQHVISVFPEYGYSKLTTYILDPIAKTILPYLGEIVHV